MRHTLAVLVVVGFLAILAVMLSGMVVVLDNPSMQLMFGSLTTSFGMVLQWYFGSSSGSERKTDLLAKVPAIDQPKEPA